MKEGEENVIHINDRAFVISTATEDDIEPIGKGIFVLIKEMEREGKELKVLISFEKDCNENFIVCYKNQRIIVLPQAFKRLTGVNDKSIVGSLLVEFNTLSEIGFIKEPVVSIVHEKSVGDMSVDEICSFLEHEGIKVHSSSLLQKID